MQTETIFFRGEWPMGHCLMNVYYQLKNILYRYVHKRSSDHYELQREQAEQMQLVMRQFGKKLEQLGGRLDDLEQKLTSESQQVSSLEKELYLSQRSQSDGLIPLVFELKINEMETRVEEL